MHTGSTDNYQLSQFASTDKPAWLVDYNEDMRKIDAGMKGNADSITELGESIGQVGEDITDLKERMNIAEQDIDTVQETIGVGELETEVKNLIGAANELLGLIHDNDGDITQLQQSIAGIGDSITGLSQLAYTIANVYDSAQTYEVGSYAIYQNTLYKCVTAITVGEAFDPAKWSSVKVMNEIHGSGPVPTVITAEEVGYDNTVSGLDATNAQAAIDEINEKFNAANISFDDVASHLGADNVQDAIVNLDAEGHNIVGELQVTTLAIGSTSATVNFTRSIGSTTIITPVCSLYGVSPTEVSYTEHSITLTFDAQESEAIVGARIQTI